MYESYFCTLLALCVARSGALRCYNCSATHSDFVPCAGNFVQPPAYFNESRLDLINCTNDENSMCFVRAWSARAHHAWIVQRGCYYMGPQDPFLKEMITPRRSMTCRHERLPDAEYTVCLCKSDWCNSVGSIESNMKWGHLAIVWFSMKYFC